MTWLQVPSDKLLEPKVDMRDMEKSLRNSRPAGTFSLFAHLKKQKQLS